MVGLVASQNRLHLISLFLILDLHIYQILLDFVFCVEYIFK